MSPSCSLEAVTADLISKADEEGVGTVQIYSALEQKFKKKKYRFISILETVILARRAEYIEKSDSEMIVSICNSFSGRSFLAALPCTSQLTIPGTFLFAFPLNWHAGLILYLQKVTKIWT